MIGGGALKATVEIGGKIAASLGASLRSAQTQVSSFGRNVNRTMNDAAIAGRKSFKGMFDNALWQQAAAGAAAIGVGMAASVRVAATFEGVLTEIGKTANASQGELKTLSGEILKLSSRPATNLGPAKLAEGIQDLVAQGLEGGLDAAVASIETLGKVATATNSDLLVVTKTGFQLQNALKIRPTELKATFDALAFAGKQGAFELRDMAQFMPTIASAAADLGVTGKKGAIELAAMMQIVRKNAPDSGQAATRLTDALLKMTAPDAVKNFKKFGVNIKQVMGDARKKGINPMEAALDELQRVTKGDIFELSKIFGDKEAKLALMSLMKYRKEYEKLKIEAGGSAATGTVDKDYERSLATFAGTLASLQSSGQRLGITLGNALLPSITRIVEAITPLVEKFAVFAEKNPGITTGIVALTGAFTGLVLALPFLTSALSILGTIGAAIGSALAPVGAVLVFIAEAGGLIGSFLMPALSGFVSSAVAGLGSIAVATWAATAPLLPWIAAIVGVGLAIKAVVDYWPEISTAATRASWQVKAQWGRFATWIGGVFNQAVGIIRQWGPKVLGVMFPIPAMIIRMFRGSNIGQKIVGTIIDGLKAKAGALFGWISGAWSRIKGLVGSGDSTTPAAPAAGTGGIYGTAAPPGRASGGPVRAGQPYIVGERRRELFVPGMDGAIIPRIARPVTAGAGVTINAPVTIHAAGGSAMEIRRQVELAFSDIMRGIESSHRMLLND